MFESEILLKVLFYISAVLFQMLDFNQHSLIYFQIRSVYLSLLRTIAFGSFMKLLHFS